MLQKYIGPVTILKRVGRVAYKVDAPSWWKMHPVFHVSLLKKYHEDIEEPQLLLLLTYSLQSSETQSFGASSDLGIQSSSTDCSARASTHINMVF